MAPVVTPTLPPQSVVHVESIARGAAAQAFEAGDALHPYNNVSTGACRCFSGGRDFLQVFRLTEFGFRSFPAGK